MLLYCRDPKCPQSTRPIEGQPLHCPRCGLALHGSVLESEYQPSVPQTAPGPRPEPEPPGAGASPPKPEPPKPGAGPTSAPAAPGDAPKPKGLAGLFSWTRTPGPEGPTPAEGTARVAPADARPRREPDRPRADDPGRTVADRRVGDGYGRFVIERSDKAREPIRLEGRQSCRLHHTRDRQAGPDRPDGRVDFLHARNSRRGLEIRPVDSINEVFYRISGPVRLAHGMRMRIADYILEYRANGRPGSVKPLSRGGERFFSLDPEPVDELVFIRPDGSAGVSIPLFQEILLGRPDRDHPRVDVPLIHEDVSRGPHARVTPLREGAVLENLSGTNGTYVRLDGPMPVPDEIVLRWGKTHRYRIYRED